MPVISGAGSLTLAVANRNNPILAVAGLLFLVGSISVGAIMILSQRSGPRRQTREGRERYLDYIEQLRHTVRDTIATQRTSQAWRHPTAEQLVDLARNPARRWERRVADSDFLVLRAGTGDEPIASALTMAADTGPLNQFDPVCLEAARELQSRYSTLHDQPITIDLRDVGVLSVLGDARLTRELATLLALSVVTLHSPQDVSIAVVRAEASSGHWDWVKWLPHTLDPQLMDGDVPARRVTASVPAMAELLAGDLEARLDRLQRSRGQGGLPPQHLVVFVDGEGLLPHQHLASPDPAVSLAQLGVHVVVLLGNRRDEPEQVDDRFELRPDGTVVLSSRALPFRLDHVPPGLPSVIARQLSPLRLSREEGDGESLAGTVGLPEILGVDDPARLDPWRNWRPGALRDLLRVPIGVGANGSVVMLDLKESAHGGMGPHGLIVGATGSGKSEMLRTLVSSLVINHGPDRLALMLVDFKGGATFAAMEDVPHIAGIITNLQDDLTLVDRMRDALFGEMQRRQELLKAAGNLPNVTAYQELVDAGEELEPLPHLLVIVDEFSELLTAKPDFAELFVAIGRIGRSIGVHLLLATQKLEMGKIRGLESHLSYRIGLRTFSENESRDAIGVADAYHLPPEPGSGYLKVDTTVFERFKAALVSSPYRPPLEGPKTTVPVVPYVSLNGVGAWLAEQQNGRRSHPERANGDHPARRTEQSTLDVICRALSDAGAEPVRPVWLRPLPEVLPLDAVMPVSESGLPGTVEAVLGMVDDPAHQTQFPLRWDFTGAEGNLVIAGAPQTGKSTLVRSMICSLALRYAPGDVAFYCVDYGGGTLRALADLPHVAAVATRVEPERITRTVSEVINILESREELFREHDLDSMTALRRARAEGRVPAEVPGDVFLVVDGWGSFREDFDAMEFTIGEVAARGLNYGVHVVLTVGQNMQVRMRMQSSFGGHLELRLTDSFDSTVDRKLMEAIPKDLPGRGLIDIGDGLMFQAAVPRIDGGTSRDDLNAAGRELVGTIQQRWPTTVARVQVLPTMVAAHELPEVERGSDLVPVGLSEHNLGPAAVDLFGSDPHLLVYGDGETGKTNALRLLVHQLVRARGADSLGFVVVDYRRSLLDVVPEDYLVAYCTSEQQAAETAAQVAGAVRERLPGPDVTSEQLRNRSWWRGVDVVVLVDDYDLVSTPSGNPLQPLLEFVPQGRDLGLHLVIARRTGGLSRAIFEPLLQRLNDVGTPGLVLSGDRMEGRLVNGVVARKLPAGRAVYAARGGGASQVQVAWLSPD
jgi:S-DNA-T family DNA segregation ATPase FtsK/SpoIIIE